MWKRKENINMADANVNKVSTTEKQKVKEIMDKLEEGLKELFESQIQKLPLHHGKISQLQKKYDCNSISTN